MDVSELDRVGTLIFEFVGEPQLMEVHVFRTEHYTGTITESEGKPGTADLIQGVNHMTRVQYSHSEALLALSV